MLVRIEMQAAGVVVDAGVPVLCVSPEGWQVLTVHAEEAYRLSAADWYLYADEEAYERVTGENISGEVIGSTTGVDRLYSWIGEADTQKERESRAAYGVAWVKGQVRLGVLAEETGKKIVDFLGGFRDNTATQ